MKMILNIHLISFKQVRGKTNEEMYWGFFTSQTSANEKLTH